MQQWSFQSKMSTRRSLRTIVIAAEGTVTEPEYFAKLNSMKKNAVFSMVNNFGNGSDPTKVLDRMREYLKEYQLDKQDEAWIVVDKDRWTVAQMAEVARWQQEDVSRHHIAVSIKKFEHWLQLHVKGDQAQEKKFFPQLSGKDKQIPDGFLNKERVEKAMRLAERLQYTEKTVGNVFELLKSFFK